LVEKTYIVKNSTSGSQSIQIIGSSGLGVTIPNGVTALVYCDGTNFYNALTGSVGNFTVNGNLAVTGTTALTGALTASTATFSGAISSVSPTFTGTPLAPTAAAGTNTTQIATTAFVLANVPTGIINMWSTATAPTGYLLCDGTAVNRTTYAALFAVISTTFGVGDGSTTFNVPNYTNRMPYGTTVGATGGSADAVVVTHTHTATSTDSGHSHTEVYYSASGGSYGLQSGPNNFQATQQTGTSTANITTTVANAGVSGINANLPPYLGINFIIKT
jgi:microcystin-dependent protein